MKNEILADLNKVEVLFNQYLEDTKSLTDEQFNQKPRIGEWSLAQAMYHTWTAIDLTALFINKQMASTKQRKSISLKNTISYILLKMALFSPFKFKVPPQLKDKMITHITHQELEMKSQDTFARFKSLIENFPKELEANEIFYHPVIGWINLQQSVGFLIEHTQHHKTQIYRIKEQVLKS